MLTLLVSQKHGAGTILWIANSNFQALSYFAKIVLRLMIKSGRRGAVCKGLSSLAGM